MRLKGVSEMMFALEQDYQVKDREADNEGSMVVKGYFLVAGDTAIWRNVRIEYPSDHIGIEGLKEGIEFHWGDGQIGQKMLMSGDLNYKVELN